MTNKQKQERLLRELQAGITWYYQVNTGKANRGTSFLSAILTKELLDQGIIKYYYNSTHGNWRIQLVTKKG